MTLRIYMSRFHREVRPEQFKTVMEELQGAGLRLLINSANRAYFDALGLDPALALSSQKGLLSSDTASYIDGDLIPAEDWEEVVYVGLRQELARGKRGRPRQKRTS